MPITKATSNVLAPDSALNNLNEGTSITLTKPTNVSANLSLSANLEMGTASQVRFAPKSTQNITQTIFSSASDELQIGSTNSGKRILIGNNVIVANASFTVNGVGIFSLGSATGALDIGADVNTTTRTANVRKLGSIVAPDFTNGRKIEFFNSDSSSASVNKVSIGGRNGGSQYAATELNFVTTPNTSTTGGTVALHINSSQNVGIGTETPSEKLTVVGNISASGNVTANTVSATSSININGTYNIQTEIEKSKILAIAYAIAL
jgi:hypothetical protein